MPQDVWQGLGVPVEAKEDPWQGLGTPAQPGGTSTDPWGGLGEPAAPAQPEDDRSVLEQVASGAALGLKRVVAPQSITPDEYHRPQTGIEAIADTVVNIGGSLAVPAAAGATALAAGATAPVAATAATAASIAYGLYAAVGGESSRAAAEGQDFNPARAAGQAFLEINPLIRGGSKVVKAARVASQIAVATGNEYSYTNDAQRAAVAGGFTLLASPILLYGMRSPKVTRETFGSVADALALPEGKRLAADAVATMEAKGPAAKSLWTHGPAAVPVAEVPKDFMLSVVPGPAKGVKKRFAQWQSQTAKDVQDDLWEGYNRSRALGEAAEKAAQRQLAGLDPEMKDISVVRAALAPAEYVGRKVDDLTGGNLEGALANYARDAEKADLVLFSFGAKGKELAKRRGKLGLADDTITRALDSKAPGHDVALKAVKARGAEDLLADYRQLFLTMRDAHLQAGGGQHALLAKAKLGADLAVSAETEINRLRKATPGGKWWESPDAAQIKTVASKLLGKEPEELTASDLANFPKLLQGSKHSILDDLGEVPEFMREFSVDKLMARFLNGSLKAAIIEPSLRRVSGYLPVVETLGMRNTAKWLTDFVDRANGTLGTLPRHWNAAMESIRKVGLRALANDPDSKTGKLLERLPAMLAKANAMAYPSFLAYTPKAAIRQLAQNVGVTAPHLGGFTGYSLVTQGTVRAAREVGLSPSELRKFLQSKGQLGGILGDIGAEADMSVAGKVTRKIEAVNEAGMAAFQYGELANRTIAYKTGEAWADEVLKGSKGALKALANSSTGLKAAIQEAGGVDVPPEKLRDIMGSYLVSMTQFRYGGPTHAKVLAHAGSAFSQFTKWPLMSSWDLVEAASKGQSRKVARAFASRMLPLTALYVAKAKLDEHEKDQAWHWTLQRWLIGNPAEWSPVSSVAGVSALPQGGPLVKGVLGGVAAAARAARADEPGKELRDSVREGVRTGLKTLVPVVSPALNEADRESQAGLLKKLKLELEGGPGHPTPSKDLVRMFPFLGED